MHKMKNIKYQLVFNNSFDKAVMPMFQKRRGVNNLLPIQLCALQETRNNHDIIVLGCNKNLGPAVIERSTYIQRVLEHLQDETMR